MITIIDYGVGNIKAFSHVFDSNNIEYKIASSKSGLCDASRIIFPGVGSFDNAMSLLNKSGMRDILEKLVICEEVPILGICVGMQMFANRSEEGKLDGLGWINADVCKFKPINDFPVPHMGWNNLNSFNDHRILDSLSDNSLFYFLHSYYFNSNDSKNVLAESDYGIMFNSMVVQNNIIGVQFHPEKSHNSGTRLLINFNLI